jgi:nucleotide-binding universal stress UspA family protein
MKANKILFPTDFSEASQHALPWATSLARDTGATLVIMHVEEPPMAYGGGEMYYGGIEVDHESMRQSLASVLPSDPTVPHEHRLVTGDPATAIVHVAETEGVDMIIMGTHGRSGFTRLLMGSVAEAVVRKAPCPVVTIKQAAAIPAEAV